MAFFLSLARAVDWLNAWQRVLQILVHFIPWDMQAGPASMCHVTCNAGETSMPVIVLFVCAVF